MTRTGVWLIGARGNVATLAVVGARAVARDLTATTGMVTAREPASRLDLPAIDDLVFGGHDVHSGSLVASARRHQERNGVPDRDVLDAVEPDLAAVDERVRPGVAVNTGPAVSESADDLRSADSLRDAVEALRADYAEFQTNDDLDRVVVVNVASTEPPLADPDRYDTREAVERAIDEDDPDLPASALYAYAALAEGHPYANFTPSTGSDLGGLREMAREENVPHVGKDGKTGETLVKSALAPMFAGRNLRVLSWEGHNVLGNEDGRVLEDEANEAGKLTSKGGVLDGILPDIGHNRVRIDYTPSLNDWKTAWDYIHFEGFLETEMTMQFTWEGSDSALAAPLVIDLARLLAYADEHGEGGLQRHLASFFKAPLDVDEHDFSRQVDMLDEYVRRHADGSDVERVPTEGEE
ncbi:myo-inositol-1-phosphate synthase [Halobacteriales archaeon QS_1_68_20]|nr:MAG: myo-inositol-1-phosphate synthase [Halobacteriales archaeon QS_1_68_20]